MKVRNVHSRALDAAPEAVGSLLDGLGSDDDRLWPNDRWPTLPFRLDGPMAPGTSAAHGLIRYSVESHEQGRRLVFRLTPGLGLSGTHRFEVEALDGERARLSHTLECEVDAKVRPLWPIVRGYHDALLEDMLDQAELAATGRHVRSVRWPVWLRAANGAELGIARLRRRVAAGGRPPGKLGLLMDRLAGPAAVAIPGTVAAIAGLHAAWALGWRWPGGSDAALAERVVGATAELPPTPLVWAVALALVGAAGILRAAAVGATRPRALRPLAWTVAGVFLARGLLYIPVDLIGGFDDIYARLDLAIYSPLCIVLGAGSAWLLMRSSGHAPGVGPAAVAGGARS